MAGISNSENEKKAIALLAALKAKIATINPDREARNEAYFKFIADYFKGLVSLALKCNMYAYECNYLNLRLVEGDYLGHHYTYKQKCMVVVEFLEARVKENDIEDLIIDYDRHTMADILSYPLVD